MTLDPSAPIPIPVQDVALAFGNEWRLDLDDPQTATAVLAALTQVARPRANLGGSGPPGRAD